MRRLIHMRSLKRSVWKVLFFHNSALLLSNYQQSFSNIKISLVIISFVSEWLENNEIMHTYGQKRDE